MMRGARAFAVVAAAVLSWGAGPPPQGDPPAPLLDERLLVTWYGNPRSTKMGILGEVSGAARAEGLRRQAAAYAPLTARRVLPAYHLVAVVAQCTAGADGA
jgi:hypothetical protein